MRIAIIGGAGNMGSWLVTHFLKKNHTLIVSDPKFEGVQSEEFETTTSNVVAVNNADLVLISVPLIQTSSVIQEVFPHMKENSVLCEISTLKSNVIEVLRNESTNRIRTLCIHPLFGPGASALRKKYALIPIKELEGEMNLAKSLFPDSQFIVVEADEHDRIMALTLSLPYFTNMILGSVLKDENIPLIEQLTGTTFAIQFMLTGSIMSHTSAFHLSLHKENNHSMEILQKLKSGIEEALSLLANDVDEFKRSYNNLKSRLEEHLDLEEKYQEMYRLLEVMEKKKGVELNT
ncbi:MAG: prephenate dehydrogenase/arogenate dehydrogenase family protein [Candidatus Thorarchaeota archaeon]|nr:prephenate dehydrogenase/arogenate dehydrogenase family protein [Candidatus Thorarchaeota archaeon]